MTPTPEFSLSNLEKMRKAGQLAAEVLDQITPHVIKGISTEELDKRCHDFIVNAGGIPACLGYRGFPKSICTSVNHVVCHGIPSPKTLQEGDILNIDVTVKLDGWHGDTSRMFYVGRPSVKAKKLVETTYECMMRGIQAIKPGGYLGDIGYAIQDHAEKNGFSVVRDFCGHGIGTYIHGEPEVLHYGKKGTGLELKPGMFITVEPMINAGSYEVKILQDDWTAVTRDKSLSAQFEHTIAITPMGYEILTLSPKGWSLPPYT
ncbi:MAG: type I methionyl aminopeptidase [Alphaproteobacteria bacterium]